MMSLPHEDDVRRANLADPALPGAEAVHDSFGLTYANYLILRRSMLECMPNEWQRRFVALLDQLQEAFDTSGTFRVQLLDHDDHYEDEDTPDEDRARVIPDPLSDYRHPNYAELARRRQPCRDPSCATADDRHPTHVGRACAEVYPDSSECLCMAGFLAPLVIERDR